MLGILFPQRMMDSPETPKGDWLADPNDYNYSQYLADMTALLARTGASNVGWVGTSMGGVLGMFLAAEPNTPIRRLFINDIGPPYRCSGSNGSALMSG